VLEHADGSRVEQRQIAVGRVLPLDRLAVLLDLGIRIGRLDPVIPPAFDVGLEKPSSDEVKVFLAQRNERE